MALAMLVLAVAVIAVAPRPSYAQQPTLAPAQEGFVPVDELPGKEELPAARLVMAAYAVAWIVVFGYLFSIWRRLDRVERDIAVVSRRIDAGARR